MDIVQHILQYDGRMKFRNGVFMNQISKMDVRYELILAIPKKRVFSNGNFCITFTNSRHLFFVLPKSNYIFYKFIKNDDDENNDDDIHQEYLCV